MQKLQLSIPEPCHENWQTMTPTDQGRFCNACAKEVIDFSMMTDTEMLNYFTTLTHEKVCGRALPAQLERVISKPKEPKKRLFWYWNYIVMFFMFFGKANNVKAQGGVKITCSQTVSPEQLNVIRSTDVSNALAGWVGEVRLQTQKIIKGKVIDCDSVPVSFASIKIKGSSIGLSADANGSYSIRVKDNDVLIITSAGHLEQEVPIGTKEFVETILEKGIMGELKGIVVTLAGGIRYRRIDEDSRIVFDSENKDSIVASKKTNAISVSVNDNNFTIYPNPVQRGSTINLNLNFKQTGLYQIQITDAAGRTVLYKRINPLNKTQNEVIICDNKWSSGVYFISIFNYKNKLVNKNSFIVQ